MTGAKQMMATTDGTSLSDEMALTRESSGRRTAHQIYLDDHLNRMRDDIESTTKKLELEKRRLNKLEQDVERTRLEHQEKVLRIKPKGGKDKEKDKEKEHKQAHAEAVPVRKLEHRKMQAQGQLDSLESENRDIRSRIDSTRRERMQMNQIFKKLQGDIRENISQVQHLQKDTDAAKSDQEDRQNRKEALRKQLELERSEFKKKVKEFQKKSEENRQDELKMKVEILAEDRKKGADPDQRKNKTRSLKAEEEDQFNSQAVMRRLLKLAFLNAIQRRHIKKYTKDIEVYEQAFQTIKSTTGIGDIEEIVKIFVALEQRNFSLLTYVNMLNREIETFEKSNRELEEQLAAKKRHEEHSEKQNIDALNDRRQQIQKTKHVTQENTEQAESQASVVERCKPLIQGIMKTVEKENRGFGGAAAPELSGENILSWLTYIEKTLTQWKDFLPDVKDSKHNRAQPNKNYKYTVGNEVLKLAPKKHAQNPQEQKLVRNTDLPVAGNLEQVGQQRGPVPGREEDGSDEEEDMESQVWTLQDLREKAAASVAKRKNKHRKPDQPGQQLASAPEQGTIGDKDPAAEPAAGELGYEDMVAEKPKADDDSDMGSDDSDLDDEMGPTDDEINEIFLKRYKMSKEELQGMADKMRIQLNNLCYLKQEFDNYDEDRSGYIDVKELKGLLQKLGEELSDEELDQAFRELDSDGSGEIEFFEFVEWFTSED